MSEKDVLFCSPQSLQKPKKSTKRFIHSSSTPTTKTRNESSNGFASNESSNIQYQGSNENPNRIIMAICENRAKEIGIAWIDLNRLHQFQISQFSDSQSYPLLISIIQQQLPHIVLFPNSQKGSHLYSCIEETLSEISSQLLIAARKYFDETEGQHLLLELMMDNNQINIEQDMEKKYLSLAAACCILKYLEFNQSTLLHPHTLSIEWKELSDSLYLNYTTIKQLEVLFDTKTLSSKRSIFSVLNHTHTVVGKRLLRSLLLAPSTNPKVLNARLDVVEELLQKRDILTDLNTRLRLYGDLDDVLFGLAIKGKELSVRSVIQWIKNLLRIRHNITLLKEIRDVITPMKAYLVHSLGSVFMNDKWNEIEILLDQYFDPSLDLSSLKGNQKHQLCLSIRSGLDAALDVNRAVYLQAVADTNDLIQQYKEQYPFEMKVASSTSRGYYLIVSDKNKTRLSNEFIEIGKERNHQTAFSTTDLISLNTKWKEAQDSVYLTSSQLLSSLNTELRQHISLLCQMTESIALLDVLCSFATVVTSSSTVWTRPRFNEHNLFVLKESWHPVVAQKCIEQNKQFVSNDLFLSYLTPTQLIVGPNYSGKSTLLRQIGVIVIIAQCGCYIPASFGSIPLFDAIYVRMTQKDQPERGLSSFASEIEDFKVMIQSSHLHYLALFDEFGKSTSVECGVALSWSILEYLSQQHSVYTLFTTHYSSLSFLSDCYHSVKTTIMYTSYASDHLSLPNYSYSNRTYSTSESTEEGITRTELNNQLQYHYGITTAKLCNLPDSMISYAQSVVSKIHVKTVRCDFATTELFRFQQEVLQRLSPLVTYSSLRNDGLKAYLELLRKKFEKRWEDISSYQ